MQIHLEVIDHSTNYTRRANTKPSERITNPKISSEKFNYEIKLIFSLLIIDVEMANKCPKRKGDDAVPVRISTSKRDGNGAKREIKKWLQLILNCINPRKILKFKLSFPLGSIQGSIFCRREIVVVRYSTLKKSSEKFHKKNLKKKFKLVFKRLLGLLKKIQNTYQRKFITFCAI